MNKLIPFILLLILFNSCEKEADTVSLNGQWQFLASQGLNETSVLSYDGLDWDTLTVPGNWDTHEKYSEYVGKGYYKRSFNVPAGWKEGQVRLKFDAVYETSKVWLNGELLGKHLGGYTPFEFNITDKVTAGSDYELIVMADNTYKRGAWWAWGGISRKVSLFRNEDIRLIYQHTTAIPDFEKNEVRFIIKYKLENNSDSVQNVHLLSAIGNGELKLKKEINASLKSNSIEIAQIQFVEPLSDFDLWHFDHPYLYQLQTELKLNGKSIDSKQDKFGIRKLEAIGEQLYLNNEVVYMNGFNRVHDHPDFGNTEPDELVHKDMLNIKALGGVFSRLMHAPQAKNLLEFCDSIGYMIIEEIPIWGDDDPQTFKDNPLTKQWLKEMIERDYNHACVVGWSVGNELRDSVKPWAEKTMTNDQFEYVNSMLDYIDELDTTRLKTYVSLTSYQKNTDLTNEPFDKLDLLCINSYGDGVKAAKNTHKQFPGKPIFLSEIGIAQIGPAPEAKLTEKLVNQLNGLKELPFVVGSAIWSYNDYRSNYKGTPESGFREWGVVDERRNKKVAYQQIKEIYAK